MKITNISQSPVMLPIPREQGDAGRRFLAQPQLQPGESLDITADELQHINLNCGAFAVAHDDEPKGKGKS